MAQRTVCVQSASSIETRHDSLVITTDRRVASIPIEDIWVLILESPACSITSTAPSKLASSGVGVLVCDKSHNPSGLLLPIGAHSRHAQIVEHQLMISKPLAKQLWKRIVQAKISNQATVLDLFGIQGGNGLRELSKNVRSGDSSNREAVAAVRYFKALLPKGGRWNGPYSGPLNYGYSVLRAGIARSAVVGGWLVSRGIHHHSDLNAFNLVDDLIEPFRPIIDLIVIANNIADDLKPAQKKVIVELFEYRVSVQEQIFTVQTAIERMLDSFKESVTYSDSSRIALPSINEQTLIGVGR